MFGIYKQHNFRYIILDTVARKSPVVYQTMFSLGWISIPNLLPVGAFVFSVYCEINKLQIIFMYTYSDI